MGTHFLLTFWLVQVLLFVSCSNGQDADERWIHTGTNDGKFYDSVGRERLFHGINRVKKAFPWYFEEFTDPTTTVYEKMQELGINVIRLGFMWSGFNPAPGVFNQTYLSIVKDIVHKLGDHGIHTLLDMHQDVLSTKFCLYDGVPLWVINKSSSPHPHPWPMKGPCNSRSWGANSLSEAASYAYGDIYANHNGMLDDLGNFWAATAAAFKDDPNIIGYEIMNEPFAGNVFKDPLLLLPGNAGRNLMKMYSSVATRIRQHDERHVIFYEPVTWGMVLNGTVVGSGFTMVPGGDAYRNRSALSFHYYCNTFDPFGPGLPQRAICDALTGPLVFKSVAEDINVTGGASMMTEGLACPTANQTECWIVANMLDRGLYSWTDYGHAQTERWVPVRNSTKQLWSRTYARAISGRAINMTFDRHTKAFQLCYAITEAHQNAPQPTTEIFMSLDHHYPRGSLVRTTPNLRASIPGTGPRDTGFRVVTVQHVGGGADEVGCVHITATE